MCSVSAILAKYINNVLLMFNNPLLQLSLCEEELNSSKKENIKLQDQLDEFKLQVRVRVGSVGHVYFLTTL